MSRARRTLPVLIAALSTAAAAHALPLAAQVKDTLFAGLPLPISAAAFHCRAASGSFALSVLAHIAMPATQRATSTAATSAPRP